MKSNWQMFPVKSRLPSALGYRFGRGYTIIRKKNLLRLKRKVASFKKKLENSKKIPPKLASGIISRIGQLKHCDSCSIKKQLLIKGQLKILKDVIRKEQKKWNTLLV